MPRKPGGHDESAEPVTLRPSEIDMRDTQLDLPRVHKSDPPGETTAVTEKRASIGQPVAYDRVVLTMLAGPTPGRVITADHSETVIGRGQGAEVHIDELGVSRRHAAIRRVSDTVCTVADLDSSNGTFVNGERTSLSMLKSGDRIQLGSSVVLRVWLTDDRDAELQRQLYEGATLDPLTGVYNRAHALTHLQKELSYARRHGGEVALMLIDADHFKEVNDSLGHLAGDGVLRAVAARINENCRVEDVVARWGGEEFVIIMRATGRDQGAALAERVRAAVARGPIPLDGAHLEVSVTVSIGVAALSELGASASGHTDLVALADARLYRAKSAGRNCVAVSL